MCFLMIARTLPPAVSSLGLQTMHGTRSLVIAAPSSSGALTNRAADCPFRGQRRSLQWLVAVRQNRRISGIQELNCLAIKIDGLHHTRTFQLRGSTLS